MRRLLSCSLISVGLLLAHARPAGAVLLDFNMDASHPAGVTISYAGGANPLIGTMISVDTVLGIDTPANDTIVRHLVGGLLSFTTGNFTSSNTNNWFFGPGGTITLTGGVDLDNDNVLGLGDIPAGTTLLTGHFEDVPDVISIGRFKIVGASGSDTKDGQLAAFYGLSASGVSGAYGLNLAFFSSASPGQAFTSHQVLSGDLVNEIPVIPEPSSALLFALGLLGVRPGRRRRRSSARPAAHDRLIP